MELFVDRSATCAAPIASGFVANLFVNLTRTCVPPSFEYTFSRNVWLLKLGTDFTAPLTVVERNDAPQASTQVAAGAAAGAAAVERAGVAACAPLPGA